MTQTSRAITLNLSLQAETNSPTAVVEIPVVEQTPPTEPLDETSSERPVSVDWSRGAIELQTETAVVVPSPLVTQSQAELLSGLKRPTGDQASDPGGHPSDRLLELPQGGLYRRTAEIRSELGERYGATAESENAVEAALRWLALHQARDGSWSFDLGQLPCEGRCSHSAMPDGLPTPKSAATGLALLAFMGAGYTHFEGKYADEIQRGLYYLREIGGPARYGIDWQLGSMYGHGIATLAIAEAAAMSRYHGRRDEELFEMIQGGAMFTVAAQHERGGWRYVPGSPGDITVTAWQVLTLISARHAGVVLPTLTLPRAHRFVASLSEPGRYAFRYHDTKPEDPTSTAIGISLMLYLGESPERTTLQVALDQMLDRGPRIKRSRGKIHHDVYHDYYATLALHHARHPDWDRWHEPLRDHLVATQATEGHEAGSWHFPDRHGDVGGRLYTTAMAAMILEVYYRFLPLYQDRARDEFRLD